MVSCYYYARNVYDISDKGSAAFAAGRRQTIQTIFRGVGASKICRRHIFSIRSRRLCRRGDHLDFGARYRAIMRGGVNSIFCKKGRRLFVKSKKGRLL